MEAEELRIEEERIKVERFKDWMLRELEQNRKNKGSILDFDDLDRIISELEYHKAKMLVAIRCDNRQAVKEYIADTANFLFCLGNVGGLYDDDFEDIEEEESIEIRRDKDVFVKTIEPQINQKLKFQ